jgi:hypothetical protein
MKKFALATAIILSLNAFGQSATKPATSDKVVTKTLYTTDEKEDIRKKFLKEVDEIGLTPEIKTKYLAIISKYNEKFKVVNKDRKLTQKNSNT